MCFPLHEVDIADLPRSKHAERRRNAGGPRQFVRPHIRRPFSLANLVNVEAVRTATHHVDVTGVRSFNFNPVSPHDELLYAMREPRVRAFDPGLSDIALILLPRSEATNASITTSAASLCRTLTGGDRSLSHTSGTARRSRTPRCTPPEWAAGFLPRERSDS